MIVQKYDLEPRFRVDSVAFFSERNQHMASSNPPGCDVTRTELEFIDMFPHISREVISLVVSQHPTDTAACVDALLAHQCVSAMNANETCAPMPSSQTDPIDELLELFSCSTLTKEQAATVLKSCNNNVEQAANQILVLTCCKVSC